MEEKEEAFARGEEGLEEGEHKWPKKNVKKIQLVKRVIKPVLAVSRRRRPMLRKD
jgi:hypothetical protein